MRLADELEQVVISLVGLRQKQEMVEPGLVVGRQCVVGGEIDFAAVNGLDLLARVPLDRFARLAQLRHTRHDSVVGDGDSGHIELGRALHHVLHVRHAVEQRILRMVMKMDKSHVKASFLCMKPLLRERLACAYKVRLRLDVWIQS